MLDDLIERLRGPDPDTCPACEADATVAIACGRGRCAALRAMREEAAAVIERLNEAAAAAKECERSLAEMIDATEERERVIAVLRARLAAAEEATQWTNDWFEPWGSWKTAWWERVIGDDIEYTADNFLRALRDKLVTQEPPHA
jgi:hypothetical protein